MTELTAGERLRAARVKAGMTAATLGKKAAQVLGRPRPISASAIRNQENGTNGIPVQSAHAYAQVLGVQPQHILWGDNFLDFNDADPQQESTEYSSAESESLYDAIRIPAYELISGDWLPATYNSRRPLDQACIYVRIPGWHSADDQLRAYEVLDGSLEPVFRKGTFLICASADRAPVVDGTYVIAGRLRGIEVDIALRRIESFPIRTVNLAPVGQTNDVNQLLTQAGKAADDIWVEDVVISSLHVESHVGPQLKVPTLADIDEGEPPLSEAMARRFRRNHPELERPEDTRGVPLDQFEPDDEE